MNRRVSSSLSHQEPVNPPWVPDTRFGIWFQGTSIWSRFVVAEALHELHECSRNRIPAQPVILDAGCGEGVAFPYLVQLFVPRRLLAIDIDERQVINARRAAQLMNGAVDVSQGNIHSMTIPNASVDVVLCHQTLHHASFQVGALREFRRVLKPQGLLLIAESCQSFTESPLVSMLFRHPQGNQRSFDSYLQLLRSSGFSVADADVRHPDPWWARPAMSFYERLGIPHQRRAPTQFLAVAVRAD